MNQLNVERKSFPWWIKLGAVLATLTLIVALTLFVLGKRAETRWLAFAAGLRSKGEPLSLDEVLGHRPPTTEGETAAQVVDRFESRMKALGLNREVGENGAIRVATVEIHPFVLELGKSAPSFDFELGVPRYALAHTKEFVEKYRAVFDDLAKMRSLPPGRLIDQYPTDRIKLLLPKTSSVRQITKFLLAECDQNVIDGNLTGAVEIIKTQWKLAEVLDSEPALIAKLVQLSVDATAIRSIRDVLHVGELGDADLLELQNSLQEVMAKRSMRFAIQGERATFIASFDMMSTGRLTSAELASSAGEAVKSAQGMSSFRFKFITRVGQLKGTELFTEWINTAGDPHRFLVVAKQIDATMPTLSRVHYFLKIIFPSLTRSAVLNARLNADHVSALVAIAAERYRLQTGKFPDSIEALVPEYLEKVPIDPFDGQPIRFLHNDDGITVYSIEENMADDGGNVTTIDGKTRPKDRGFRLFTPDVRKLKITDDQPPSIDK